MKLHLEMLDRLVELPVKEPQQLRQIFDDLGLEVQDLDVNGERAVYNLETLANRADHASVIGVAREIAARYLTAIKSPPVVSDLGGRGASAAIRKVTDRCFRYALLEMALPPEMKLRPDVASVAGTDQSDRHPIVAISNFVLLELGQPTHAFDREKIEGEIVIDLTTREEEIVALDGRSYRLPPQSIVIRDRKKIVAVGGVIGCANSMVTPATTRVLIESAAFDPLLVRKTARAMGLATEASFIFERGCDRDAVATALKRIAYLAGSGGGVVRDIPASHVLGYSIVEGEPTERRRVMLRLDEIRRQMNLPRLKEIEITSRLKNLGYLIEASGNEKQLQVVVPSWRLWDVEHEQDLVEDFVRSHGLNKVKQELPPLDYEQAPPNDLEVLRSRVDAALIGGGFCEVITKSYYSAEEAALLGRLDPQRSAAHATIKNAVERAHSHLKVTNLVHLAQLLERNQRHGVLTCKVFEFTRLFSRERRTGQPYEYEHDVLTMAAAGRWYANEWRKPPGLEEFALLFKGVIHALFKGLGVAPAAVPSSDPLLHPGVQSAFKVGSTVCGVFGLIHPELKAGLELKHDLLYAEFENEKLLKVARAPAFQQPSDFPVVRRDITLKLPERDPAGAVVEYINALAKPHVRDVRLVDVFKKAEEQFRRVSCRITFQSHERTLANEEADAVTNEILTALKDKHGLDLAG